MTYNIDMNLDPDDLSVFPLKILRYGSFHPALNSVWTTMLIPVNIGVCVLFLILAIKGVFVSYHDDIFFTAECLQTCILMIHTLGKFLALYSNKRALCDLLIQKSRFWKIKDFDSDTYQKNHQISTTAGKIIRYYFYLIICVGVVFDLQPFSTGNLPTKCYVPQGWFKFLTVSMWYTSYMVLTGLNGTDCFFCSLAMSLFVQLKLLSHKFNKLSESRSSEAALWNELKKLVDFHKFLINYCEKLNTTYNSVFFLQFMVSIASASVSVFIFMQPGQWTNRTKFLLYFLAILIETSFYCVPLEFIANAAIKISQSVYDSKWYNVKNIHFRKCLTVIMSKSQKPVIFSAYGLIWMNLRTFVVICKTTFSFYTYLNSVNKIK